MFNRFRIEGHLVLEEEGNLILRTQSADPEQRHEIFIKFEENRLSISDEAKTGQFVVLTPQGWQVFDGDGTLLWNPPEAE